MLAGGDGGRREAEAAQPREGWAEEDRKKRGDAAAERVADEEELDALCAQLANQMSPPPAHRLSFARAAHLSAHLGVELAQWPLNLVEQPQRGAHKAGVRPPAAEARAVRVQVDEHVRQVLRPADGEDGDIARAVSEQAERGAFGARADLSEEQLEALCTGRPGSARTGECWGARAVAGRL